jgi:hypothetical protein
MTGKYDYRQNARKQNDNRLDDKSVDEISRNATTEAENDELPTTRNTG